MVSALYPIFALGLAMMVLAYLSSYLLLLRAMEKQQKCPSLLSIHRIKKRPLENEK
jgi:hypothetical protein